MQLYHHKAVRPKRGPWGKNESKQTKTQNLEIKVLELAKIGSILTFFTCSV